MLQGGDRHRNCAPRRPACRKVPAGARREQAVHAVGRPSVLDLRRLSRRGDRAGRRPPRADGRVRRRGLGQGHAHDRRLRADRRAGRDQRDERDRLGEPEPLADAGARRARAASPLGPGLAAGDRSRAVRRAAGQARGDAVGDRRDPVARRRRDARRAAASLRPGIPRLPARPRVHGGRARARPAAAA